MPSQHADQAAQAVVGTAALAATTGNYVYIPPPESILEFSIFLVDLAGATYDFSVRDLLFITTAGIAMWTFNNNRKLKVKKAKRRSTDKL